MLTRTALWVPPSTSVRRSLGDRARRFRRALYSSPGCPRGMRTIAIRSEHDLEILMAINKGILSGAGGVFPGSETFSTAGTTTHTVQPHNAYAAEGWGAGGGGAGHGAGAGSGGIAGASTFEGLTANGGQGGRIESNGATATGGTATGGDVNTTGASGNAQGNNGSKGGNAANTAGGGGQGGATQTGTGNGNGGASPGGAGGGGYDGSGLGPTGGGGGAYVQKAYALNVLAVGAALSVTVGARGTAGTGAQTGGLGGLGRWVISWT